MKNLIRLLISLIFLILPLANLMAQLSLTDVYGNPMPTPSWPLSDSLYEHNTITVWFNDSVINTSYLCDFWHWYHNPPKVGGNRQKPLE